MALIDLFTSVDWRPVVLTIQIASVSTAISLIVGVALGYWLASRNFPGKRWIMAAVLMPLVLPPTVLGFYLLVLLGRRGPIGELWMFLFDAPLVFTWKAAVVAACVSTIPIVTRQLSAAFATIDHETTEAARLDGAGGFRIFIDIYIPQIQPAIFAAATIAFARAVGDFGATLMVAGNIPGKTQTASIAIYEMMNSGRDGEAMVLAIIISIMALIILAYTTGGEVRNSRA